MVDNKINFRKKNRRGLQGRTGEERREEKWKHVCTVIMKPTHFTWLLLHY